MRSRPSPHTKALLLALFVTFLWATSWVLIKLGLKDVPPITFAGLRYGLAFLCLAPFVLTSVNRRTQIRRLRSRDWGQLALLGLTFIAITQGAQYIALLWLPATTLTVLLNASVLLVAAIGYFFLDERLVVRQWLGIVLFLLGIGLYFRPAEISAPSQLGLLAAGIAVLSNALSSILGRQINRRRHLDPVVVTFLSIGIGGAVLLAGGLFQHGIPKLSVINWVTLIWLAVINTALAFTLWNRTLQMLSAVESSLVNNTISFQIAALAWIFLGERFTWLAGVGLVVSVVGIFLVQVPKKQRE